MTLVEAVEYIRNDEAHDAALAGLQGVREVLEGVIRVADRKTVEFDRARALLERLRIKEQE